MAEIETGQWDGPHRRREEADECRPTHNKIRRGYGEVVVIPSRARRSLYVCPVTGSSLLRGRRSVNPRHPITEAFEQRQHATLAGQVQGADGNER